MRMYSSGKLNHWYHIDCLLGSFTSARAKSKPIETVDDISGWHTIGDLDKDLIIEKLEKLPSFRSAGATTNSSSNFAPSSSSSTKVSQLSSYVLQLQVYYIYKI